MWSKLWFFQSSCTSVSWLTKKTKPWGTYAFKLWCWRIVLRGAWTVRRGNQIIHWREWSWSGSSNTLATGCKDQTHLKRPWCWEILVNMNLSKLWEIVKDREAWHVAVYGVARSWTWLSDWTAFDVGALDWLSQHRTYSPNRDTLRVRQSSVKRYSRTIVLACLGHPVCREPPLWTLVCPWLAIKFF